jgi:hypothetical protein
MTPALLDTDTLTLWFKRHPQVELNAALYTAQFGQLVISDLSYYEVTRGWKAIGAATQLARVEEFLPHPTDHPLYSRCGRGGSRHLVGSEAARPADRRSGHLDRRNRPERRSRGCDAQRSHFGRVGGLQVVDWTV